MLKKSTSGLHTLELLHTRVSTHTSRKEATKVFPWWSAPLALEALDST